jgi:hypothetical protein
MKTFVYVDGLNLYHRALIERPEFKWLNPLELAKRTLSQDNDIVQLNYYTTPVSSRLDPEAPQRQGTYFQALSTIPCIKSFHGKMQVKKKWMPIAPQNNALGMRPKPWFPVYPRPKFVRVYKNEEKGSDVNLGAHLVRDAFQGKFEVAAIVTNDSDLTEPIRIVVEELNIPVGIICPIIERSRPPSKSLESVASFFRRIDDARLRASQFPEEICLPNGAIVKRPFDWQASSLKI